jgi:ketosteroid isomerase-like protein
MTAPSKTGTSMSTAAVAQQLVDLCREGQNLEAIDRLYSPDIVSVEAMGNETMPAEMRGIEAVRGKNQWWFDNFEVVSANVNGPFIGEGDQFAVQHEYETKEKATGKQMTMSEMALYTVKDGKIVHERFYYKTN